MPVLGQDQHFVKIGPRHTFFNGWVFSPSTIFHLALCKVVRTVMKFARKYFAAQLLNAKLFCGEQDLAECRQEIHSSALYINGDKILHQVLELHTHRLQQWVRGSFLSDSNQTDALKKFIAIVVKPAITVNVDGVSEKLVETMNRFIVILTGTEATEADATNLKIACSAMRGELDMHPLIQGLALQARRQVNKRLRGIETMAGRRSAESQREADLISDAGLTLAMHAGNTALAKEFGLSSTSLKINFDILVQKSLPVPALALNWPEVIKQNFKLVDQRYFKDQNTSKCALTYLENR